MEGGTQGEEEGEGAQSPSLPEGVFAETVEHAVEASRFGIDTLLLVSGSEADLSRVAAFIDVLAKDGSRLPSVSTPMWKWAGAGTLVLSTGVDRGRTAYQRLHPFMTGSEAAHALEIVSARTQ